MSLKLTSVKANTSSVFVMAVMLAHFILGSMINHRLLFVIADAVLCGLSVVEDKVVFVQFHADITITLLV